MFQRILVPLDGSLLAERALPVAAHMARATGASLTLLRAFVGLEDLTWQVKGMPVNISNVLERERKEATAYLQNIAASSSLQSLDVRLQAVQAHPAQAILSEAQTYGMDAIILSSHGEKGLRRWMMGSVSLKVVRHSHVPVLLLRPQDEETAILAQETTEQICILVPLDGSALAEEALAPAIALCRALPAAKSGSLHLACVVPLFTTQALDIDQDEAVKAAQSYLTTVEQRLRQQEEATNLTITSTVILDLDVAHAIVTLAETVKGMEQSKDFTGCDLIAMSTHGRGDLAHRMMGSVTERVLDASRLPMLIVHPKEMQVKQQAEQRKKDETTDSVQSWVGLL
jgi:nucleotide-binding universal stress UspA family protein